MRLKLDENLPTILVEDLVELGHDVDTAMSEGLAGHEDSEVWSGAQAAGRMLLTQDLDFLTFEPLHLARIPAWYSSG
jgi:predicted nuclease of predicted toxin-antitoxin system